MIQNYNYTSQYDNMQIAYDSLYTSFMKRDRKAIEYYCRNCENLGIGQFHEKANMEMERIYSLMGIKTIRKPSTLEQLPDDVLLVYAQACMNVLFNEKMRYISDDFHHTYENAYHTLVQPKQYHTNDVLYSQGNNMFTVGNFLKVIKYALSIAEIINPDDKRFANASASVLALQTIDNILSNKSGAELTKHTLHIATDFLASNVKESLNDTNAKRSVAVSALMVNLAIDFLAKDDKEAGFPINKQA